jgi:septum formation protein
MFRKIILASQSPRRKKLLEQIGLDFEIKASKYEEDMNAKKDPQELVQFLALNKAQNLAKNYQDAIIIGADTVVVYQNNIIGKPKNIEEARKTLNDFSDQEHEVITGFAIIDTKLDKFISGFDSAQVKFRKLDQKEIEDYIQTGEPLDKAGSYGIQSKGATLIESIKGDYFSVVGLPLTKIYLSLKELNVDLK